MFKKLVDNVKRWMRWSSLTINEEEQHSPVTFEATLRRSILYKEYNELSVELRKADNLLTLLELRKRIVQFQKDVIDNSEYNWGKQYILDLHKVWKIKYHKWKKW